MNLGRYGEGLAVDYLKTQGYKILERNFKARHVEIDIVAQDKDILVFVEVKTRFSDQYGTPEEAVTRWKLRNLKKGAQYYKLFHPELPEALRIDVVAIELNLDRSVKRLNFIKNAAGY